MSDTVLEIRGLSVRYVTMDGTSEAVSDVSLTINKGETLGLVGETGAGKTTTALSILNLLPTPPAEITSGEILFEGEDVLKMNDAAIRALEGMEQGKGWFPLEGRDVPASAVTEICENGVYYRVDVENGQKTGFFLDQKYNRLAVARLARGRRVLDCFTHTGSFALNAARGGAEHVTAVDISQSAIDMARANAVRNRLEGRMDFLTADVFDLLTELEKKGGKPYDFIILDPPAFTKSRKTVKSAERGYKDINLRALRLLPRGGYFATASCSHFMPSELFEKMLRSAALDAGVELRQIEARQQSPDHPILWNVPETDYLKFYLFQVV